MSSHARMTALNRLVVPMELIRPILENIEDPATLYNLCLSCDLLRSEAEYFLYRSYTDKRTNTRHLRFLATVNGNTRLAALVICYRIEMDHTTHYTSAILDLIGSALQRMVNLKELSVAIPAKYAKAIPLDKCTFQLRRMRWIEQTKDPMNQLGSMFVRWLATQAALKHLDWLCRRPQQVQPSACPELVSLRGTQKAMYALLPGRNITRFHGVSIRGHYQDQSLKYNLISAELAKLRSLSVQNFFQCKDYVSLCERHLQSLEYLELYELYDTHVTSLKLPPNLKILVFSPRPIVTISSSFTSIEVNIETLFERCRHLKRIDLAYEKKSDAEVYYKRWIRRGDTVQKEPELLTWDEVAHGRMELIEEVVPTLTSTPAEEVQLEYDSDWDWDSD